MSREIVIAALVKDGVELGVVILDSEKRNCDLCKKACVIAPSSIRRLKENPKMELNCIYCFHSANPEMKDVRLVMPTPEQMEELERTQEVRRGWND